MDSAEGLMESDAIETNGKERVGQVVKEINRPQSKTPLRYMTLMEDEDVAEVGRGAKWSCGGRSWSSHAWSQMHDINYT